MFGNAVPVSAFRVTLLGNVLDVSTLRVTVLDNVARVPVNFSSHNLTKLCLSADFVAQFFRKVALISRHRFFWQCLNISG